jgi:hypothetical protein
LLVSIAGRYRAIPIPEFEQGIGCMLGTNLNRTEEPAAADDLDRETRLRFMQIDTKSGALLQELWPVIETALADILEGFYRHVIASRNIIGVTEAASSTGDITTQVLSAASALNGQAEGRRNQVDQFFMEIHAA